MLLSLLALDVTTSSLFVAAFLLSLLWFRASRRPPGLPPGPGPALPVLGHVHLLEKDPRNKFREWRKKYGDVFSFYQGPQLVVVLNGYKTIKEALVKHADVFSVRPKSFWVGEVYKNMGLSGSSGQDSKEQRKITLEVLTRLGVGKNYVQYSILEEIEHYVNTIESYNGKSVDLWDLTHTSVSNNICSFAMGRRFNYDDPLFTSCMKMLEDNLYDSARMENFNFIPFKQYIPGDPFHWNATLKRYREIEVKLLTPFIREAERKVDAGQLDGGYTNYIEGYVMEIRRRQKAGIASSINGTFLLKSLTDVWAAGTETSATTIMWTLAHFLRHPDVQEKCYQDVVRVIGTQRQPTMEDRDEMPYLQATIMETLRLNVNAPFSLPHGTAFDVMFRDYVIPKGTTILPSLESALLDPEVWEEPLKFRPERFISAEGKLNIPEEFIPFSIGRRFCLGRSLAYMELHLYLASLVQRFRFLPSDDGTIPSLHGILGIVCNPEPFKVRAVLRQ